MCGDKLAALLGQFLGNMEPEGVCYWELEQQRENCWGVTT